MRDQLGREPTTPFVVVCRCTGGHPLVIRNAPTDAAGDPFPTTYWLTCPTAVKAVARVEADGWIAKLNERATTEETFAASLSRAHHAYAEDRAQELPEAFDWGGVGGTRRGVKCLHAHYANHLSGAEDPVGAWVAARVEPVHAEQRGGRVAAVDQGTNSVRLLVLEPGTPHPTELARDMVITRLGSGVDRTGTLQADAIARTLAVLARYCRRARALGAERIRMGATSAVRDAANRADFLGPASELLGGPPEILTGEEEAAVSYLGATRGLDGGAAPLPYLVQDIGGGSTEFVLGKGPGRPDRAVSTQMGSVRLTERCVGSDPPSPQDLRALEEAATVVVDDVASSLGHARTLIGVAGTATTLQALALGLARYDPDRIHRTWLGLTEVEGLLGRLASMTNGERAALPVMAPGRGDVIVAGAVILAVTMRRLGFDRTLVSETDILDGLAIELLDVG